MEIEKNFKEKNTFRDLSQGDVFNWGGSIYMVIEKDYGLKENDLYDGYAIDLETGSIYSFDNDDECTKVSAKLTVTN